MRNRVVKSKKQDYKIDNRIPNYETFFFLFAESNYSDLISIWENIPKKIGAFFGVPARLSSIKTTIVWFFLFMSRFIYISMIEKEIV